MSALYTGQFKIAEQTDDWAVFADVIADVTVEEAPGRDLTRVDCEAVEREWQWGARFGAEYAIAHLPASLQSGKAFRVYLRKVDGHVVDTTGMVVGFAVAHAVWRALGAAPRNVPTVDPQKRCFVFPK